MKTTDLDATQEKAVKQLASQLEGFADKAKDISWDDAPSCFPLVTSTIGILGGRGAGKSTVLNHFVIRVTQKQIEREESPLDRLKDKVIVLKPLDCSVLPRDCEPGMVVLSHILNGLKHPNNPLGKINEQDRKDLLNELDEHIIGLYTKIGATYNEFSMELSSTPDDYGVFLAQGLNDRLSLKDRITCWLSKLFKTLNAKQILGPCEKQNKTSYSILVVPLDDFDLAPGEQIRKWLQSLLDELCQYRLVFVLTADFYRLEHLIWDAKDNYDDKTGRALLNKLMPLQNRVNLAPWQGNCRAMFKPSDVKQSSKISCCCGTTLLLKDANNPELNCPKCQQILSANPVLWFLVERTLKAFYSNPALVYSLLPDLPRGLEGLYYALQEYYQSKENLPIDPEVFWHLLATSRSEPVLARRFSNGSKETWATEFGLEDRDMPVEQWTNLLERSVERAKPYWKIEQENNIKIKKFEDGLKPMDLVIETDRENLKENFKQTNSRRAPMFHDQLHIRPLRDAIEIDRPLWVELLLDNELADSPRYRSQFLLDWRPLNKRLETVHFFFPSSIKRFVELVEDNPDIERSVFYWLHQASGLSFNIGWLPLFSALREERNPIDPSLFNRLFVDPRLLQGRTPDNTALEILPNRLWAMILFVDGLHRCPWSAFSSSTVWMMATYIGLAAAFVRSAYAYALNKAYPASEPNNDLPDQNLFGFSEAQLRFIDVIKTYDERKLLNPKRGEMQQETVLESLGELFRDEWEEKIKDLKDKLEKQSPRDYEMESLVNSSYAFLHSPVYTSVKALLSPHCRRAREFLEKEDNKKSVATDTRLSH